MPLKLKPGYGKFAVNSNFRYSQILSNVLGEPLGKAVNVPGENGTYTSYNSQTSAQEVPYKPFWIVNMKAGWKNEQWNLFVEINNLFDRRYYDIANIPQPGQWIFIGFRYKGNLTH